MTKEIIKGVISVHKGKNDYSKVDYNGANVNKSYS